MDASTHAKIAALEERLRRMAGDLAERDEEIRQLRAELGGENGALPNWLPYMTRRERQVLAMLTTGRLVTYQAAMLALYSDQPDDQPDQNILKVYVSRIRRKLAPFGFKIETLWGVGYQLPPESVALLNPESEAA